MLGALLACSDGTGPRGPKLAASYTVTSVDGVALPAPVMVLPPARTTAVATNLEDGRFQFATGITGWLLRTRTTATDPLTDYTGVAHWNERIVGEDSVEFSDDGDPVAIFFAGHFNDTLLVLYPVTAADAHASVNDVWLHSWTFHADTAIHP